ncbi:hypothetical protein OG394_16175 [Kribbella sp. NBC_01245]|uniref:hypothetical protein n=1 Tax=Kribbella sp. NBC_01245 TaxID=2903578 RepID=UPI002E2ABC05|nr:hypothetical protein [Kribbella sp. NBC_01245]
MIAVRRIAAAAAAMSLMVGAVPAGAAPTAKAKAAVSLKGPTSAPYGSTIKFTGLLWKYGTTQRIAGATVTLQRATHGTTNWTTIKSAKTSSAGAFTFGVSAGARYDYRARWGGSAAYTTALSGVLKPATAHKVVVDSFRATTADGDGIASIDVRGRVFPKPPAYSTGRLQRWNPDSRQWVNIGLASNTDSGSGSNILDAWGRGTQGIATYRLLAVARGPWAAGASAPFTLPIYRSREAISASRYTEGASGASAGSRWMLVDGSRLEQGIETSTARWVTFPTATCRTMVLRSYAYNGDTMRVAPVISVVSDAGTLFAKPFERAGTGWSVPDHYPIPLKGARQVRVTVTNRDAGTGSFYQLSGALSCYGA